MEFYLLIGGLIACISILWLAFNNYDLRANNRILLMDNTELFNQKSSLAWQLDKTKHELRLMRAEYGYSMAKSQQLNDTK